MEDVDLIKNEVSEFLVFMTNGSVQLKLDLTNRFIRNFVPLIDFNIDTIFERIAVEPALFDQGYLERIRKTDRLFKLVEHFLRYQVMLIVEKDRQTVDVEEIQGSDTASPVVVLPNREPSHDDSSSSPVLTMPDVFDELIEMLNFPFKAFCFNDITTQLLTKNAQKWDADILLGGAASQKVLGVFIKHQFLYALLEKVQVYDKFDDSPAKPFLESNLKLIQLRIHRIIFESSNQILELYKTGILVESEKNSNQPVGTTHGENADANLGPENNGELLDGNLVRYAAYRLLISQPQEFEFSDPDDVQESSRTIFMNKFTQFVFNGNIYTYACKADAHIASVLNEHINNFPLRLNSQLPFLIFNRLSLHHIRNLSFVLSISLIPFEGIHRVTEIPFVLSRGMLYVHGRPWRILSTVDFLSIVKDIYLFVGLISIYTKYFNSSFQPFYQPLIVNLFSFECAAVSSRGLMILNSSNSFGVVDVIYLTGSYVFPRAAVALSCISYFTFFIDVFEPIIDRLKKFICFLLNPFYAIGRVAATLFFNNSDNDSDDDNVQNSRYNCPFDSTVTFVQFLLDNRLKDLTPQDGQSLQQLLVLFGTKVVDLKDVMLYLEICKRLDIELLPGEIMALKLACFKAVATHEDKREILNTEIALNVIFRVEPTVALIEKAEGFIAQYIQIKAEQLRRLSEVSPLESSTVAPDAAGPSARPRAV